LDLRFILGAKQSDHTFLFDWVASTPQTAEASFTDLRGFRHRFRYLNGATLNEANFELGVNFLEYWEHAPDGTVTHFAWVTDIPINDSNLMTLMRGARARWKIENETFNTLKNPGYHVEHNFGHGHQHLSTVLIHLMMLAFLIDQIQQRCCRLFHAPLAGGAQQAPPVAEAAQPLRPVPHPRLGDALPFHHRAASDPLGRRHLLAVGRDRPCSKCVLEGTQPADQCAAARRRAGRPVSASARRLPVPSRPPGTEPAGIAGSQATMLLF
jgi:hypothetical protein